MLRLRSFIITTVFALACASNAIAQGYPNRTVRLVVPWPPGGLTDIVSRLVAGKLSERWGQPVVVENRAGANGMIGADHVAKSVPDGYTLVTANPETHGLNHLLYSKMPYDAIKEFEPVSLMVTQALVLVAHPDVGVKSLPELIALARSKPGQIRYSSWGRGSTSHLAMESLRTSSNIELLHIPYKGAGPAFTDVMAGVVDIMFSGIAPAVPQIKAQKVSALAISSAERSASLPAVPTVAEQGVAGYDMSTWYGISAPRGTPPDVVARISESIQAVLKDPGVIERLTGLGAVIVGSTPQGFREYNERSLARWAQTAQAAGVKPE